MIDFAPKAIATIKECQDILSEYIVPNSGISDHECINRLLGVLDDKRVVIPMREILETIK